MLIIEKAPKRVITEDAVNTFPDECCGFLLGYEDNDARIVTEALPVDNAKDGDKRRRFEITPQDYLKAERIADEKGLLLLGVYHSHPNHPSVPSEQDRLSAQPFFSYVIISVINNEFFSLQSWRLTEDRYFEEEPVHEFHYA